MWIHFMHLSWIWDLIQLFPPQTLIALIVSSVLSLLSCVFRYWDSEFESIIRWFLACIIRNHKLECKPVFTYVWVNHPELNRIYFCMHVHRFGLSHAPSDYGWILIKKGNFTLSVAVLSTSMWGLNFSWNYSWTPCCGDQFFWWQWLLYMALYSAEVLFFKTHSFQVPPKDI